MISSEFFYDWSPYGDKIDQIAYELAFYPDSYISTELKLWYDALYRASSEINDYSNQFIYALPDGTYEYSNLEAWISKNYSQELEKLVDGIFNAYRKSPKEK